MRILSLISDPRIVDRILRHRQLDRIRTTDPFESRAPPLREPHTLRQVGIAPLSSCAPFLTLFALALNDRNAYEQFSLHSQLASGTSGLVTLQAGDAKGNSVGVSSATPFGFDEARDFLWGHLPVPMTETRERTFHSRIRSAAKKCLTEIGS